MSPRHAAHTQTPHRPPHTRACTRTTKTFRNRLYSDANPS
jgi:hypothetical protein